MPLLDTERVNIEFVITVKDYPVLYNHNMKEYSNRNENDKVWRIIGEKFQATDLECKQRWRNIRCALVRYIRIKNTTGSAAKKPYYLWDYLQYLLPFTKSRPQSSNLGVSSSSHQQTTATDHDVVWLKEETRDEETGDYTEQDLPTVRYVTPPVSRTSSSSSTLSSWRSSKNQGEIVDPLENVMTNCFEKKANQQMTTSTQSAADLNFLSSLLPDVTSLPPKKKRMFKRKVIELLEELSEDS